MIGIYIQNFKLQFWIYSIVVQGYISKIRNIGKSHDIQ
jgi:hypothetical protein